MRCVCVTSRAREYVDTVRALTAIVVAGFHNVECLRSGFLVFLRSNASQYRLQKISAITATVTNRLMSRFLSNLAKTKSSRQIQAWVRGSYPEKWRQSVKFTRRNKRAFRGPIRAAFFD